MKPTGQERKGHGYGLHFRLLDAWSQRHHLQALKDAGSISENGLPTESPCRKNLFCVCGNVKDGADAFYFHSKMISLLRPYLFAKREKAPQGEDQNKQTSKPAKVQTKARKALSKAFLVLELRQTGLEQLPAIADPAFASWAPRTPAACSVKAMQSKRLWFHIGYCNFKTMHWTGLRMECMATRNNGEDGLEQVELAVKNPVECFRCFEFLQSHVAFALKYEAHFWALRSTRLGLNRMKMIPNKLIARPFASIPPLVVWKGSADEARDRDAHLAAMREKKTKPRKARKELPRKELTSTWCQRGAELLELGTGLFKTMLVTVLIMMKSKMRMLKLKRAAAMNMAPIPLTILTPQIKKKMTVSNLIWKMFSAKASQSQALQTQTLLVRLKTVQTDPLRTAPTRLLMLMAALPTMQPAVPLGIPLKWLHLSLRLAVKGTKLKETCILM